MVIIWAIMLMACGAQLSYWVFEIMKASAKQDAFNSMETTLSKIGGIELEYQIHKINRELKLSSLYIVVYLLVLNPFGFLMYKIQNDQISYIVTAIILSFLLALAFLCRQGMYILVSDLLTEVKRLRSKPYTLI